MPFSDLVGNAAVIARLSRMVDSGRIPGSMLFSGRAGVGKLQAAVALAQALNCVQGDTDACGACTRCLRIARDEFPDVRVLRPEGKGGQLRAEGMRQALAELPFRPFEGKRRLMIVAEAERMNPTTGNSLLKVLEEPPEWATLILVTSNEGAILPTIQSRCQTLRFSPLALEALEGILVSRHGVPNDRARLLAAVSGGGLARALELREEPLDDLRKEALRMASVAAEGGRATELVPWADALSREARLLLLLELLISLLRDLAARSAGVPPFHRDLEAALGELSSRAPISVWLQAYSFAEEALIDLRDRYLNRRITLSRLLASFEALSAP